MKLRFTQECTDKNTNVLYQVGAIYEFGDERAREILKSGLAEVVEEVKKSHNKAVEEEKSLDERLDNGEVVDLNSLTKAELTKLAKEQGVSVRGTKEDIIERLVSSDTNNA